MFQSVYYSILQSLPPDPSGVIVNCIVAIAIGIGALTCLLGALHSRPTISMIMFCLGTVAGYLLPGWLGYHFNVSISIAVGGVVLGLVGYLLHRWCVAVCLGVLVAAVATVILYDQTNMTPAPVGEQPVVVASVGQMLSERWETAPDSFRKLVPWVAIGAFVASAALAIGLPKFGMAAFYSLGGTVLTLFAIGLGHSTPKITWLDSLKSGPMTVAALGITMLLVGFLAQVGLVYRPTPRRAEEEASATQRQSEFG